MLRIIPHSVVCGGLKIPQSRRGMSGRQTIMERNRGTEAASPDWPQALSWLLDPGPKNPHVMISLGLKQNFCSLWPQKHFRINYPGKLWRVVTNVMAESLAWTIENSPWTHGRAVCNTTVVPNAKMGKLLPWGPPVPHCPATGRYRPHALQCSRVLLCWAYLLLSVSSSQLYGFTAPLPLQNFCVSN